MVHSMLTKHIGPWLDWYIPINIGVPCVSTSEPTYTTKKTEKSVEIKKNQGFYTNLLVHKLNLVLKHALISFYPLKMVE